ncbi:MAG: VWA domain-containing protein [Bacteroidales bacterium]|nr:VWA domain-containing protein [Bacteroidales bacterium]
MKEENVKKTSAKRVYNLIIVDESGSMEIIHREALAGINETIATCKKLQEMHSEMEQHVTLITFDSCHFKVHYDDVLAMRAQELGMNEYRPSGGTPLYDAIGKGVAKVNAQTEVGDNVLVTIITDGEENSSREYTLKMVKNLIEKQKKLGWTFTLIGTDNLDVEGMAGAMAIDNHLAFAEDDEGTREMFRRERNARVNYNMCCLRAEAMETGTYFREEEV